MKNRSNATQSSLKRTIALLFLLVMTAVGANRAVAEDDVTGYETVHVSIPATSYDGVGKPQMARVKYNKQFPLVITSDDMGKTELTNNWAEVNGYPNINANVDLGIQPGGTDFLAVPYKKYYMQGGSSDPADYQPMTYTDNVGKTQRYRMTSAIMPYELANNSYSKISANDAKLMLRTGWSFAQHDVNDISSVENISTAMTNNSNIWANKVGIGLKVMVEPNGNHNYLEAGNQNRGVCWNIFQNSTSEYPDNDKTIADWTDGSMPSTFSSKPTGGYIRSFFQGNESSWKTNVDAADGTKMIIGGTHGLGDEIKSHLRSASNVTNNAWVGSADEIWEYYHIYNNVKIGDATFADGKLTFDVQVPTYKKNQYRELTLNIPGLTGTGAPTFSTANGTTVPVTGGYKIDGGTGIGYTMNIGLETSIYQHIDELMTIYRDDQTNLFVKRDLEYLIAQLWDGRSYTAQLNAAPAHDLTVQSSLGTTLATIKTDTDGEKSFAAPRYIVSGDKLYETAAATTGPKYAKTISTTSTPSDISYSEKSLASLKVEDFTPKAVLVVEGEDMAGMTILGADLDLAQTSHGRYWAMALGSNGMAGNLVSGKTATVTSALPRGKYKAVIGYGETYKSQGTYSYHLLVDGTQVATVSTSSASNNAVTELTTAEFDVTVNNQPVTLTTDNTNTSSRWIDYIYFVQTGSLEPQAPSVAATASAGTTAAIVKGKSITVSANATQRGGSNFKGISLYQYNSAPAAAARLYNRAAGADDGGILVASSETETVSYTFTPNDAGNYYFKAVANDGTLGDGTSDVITVNVVDAIDTYTLSIIDKSGNVALTTTVAASSLTDSDPLANAFRSPFAQNYKYYNTIAEAQANSGSAFATTDDWIQSTVYVGYDVDATKMAEGKVHAIWGNGQIMHIIYNAKNSKNAPTGTLDWYQNAQYDVETPNKGNSTGPYIQHSNISATSLPFLDNSYMWDLGTDPYNIKLRNKAFNVYASSTAYNVRTLYDHDNAASAESYCLLYWRDRNSGGYGSVDTSAEYYRLMHRGNQEQILQGWSNQWGASADLDNWNTRGKLYVKELPAVNLNVLDAKKNVECTLQYYLKSDANMPTDGTDGDTSYYTPFNLYRSYTSKHKWWYDAAATDAITNGSAPDASKITKNGGNIYVTYTLDSKWNSNNVFYTYPEGKGTVHWYTVNFKNNNTGNYYLIANTDISDPLPRTYESSNLSTADYDSNHKEYYWAFSGTPYNLKLINMYHGIGNYLGVAKANTAYMASTYLLPDNNDNNVTWEMVDGLYWEQSHPYLRLQKSLNGETEASDRPLYLRRDWNSSYNPLLDRTTDGYTLFLFTEKTTTDITSVSLSASAGPYYVDQAMTLTATATPTPSGTDRVSSLVIQQEVNGEWTAVTTAEAATKDETTKAVTVTYSFTPAAEGTFNFRAYAVVDGEDQYSTAEASAGGDGDVVEVIATVKQLTPYNNTYTLTLIDKNGNELLTETAVPKSRITAVNTVSKRNGDPLANEWRSPLVTLYKYYNGTEEGKASAQAADDNYLVDWNSYEGTTVYVGYTVSDAIDLNGKDSNGNYKFSSLNNDANSLMQNRVHRDNNDANPLVRDASKFGKMYMLKFKTSAAYNLEDGSDNRNATATPANTLIYPYTNGDGPIYMYSHQRYLDQKDNGASTRTRWPWFLVSPKNDPYHVYITSWQSSHTDNTDNTNHYSYLRTYYNSTINQVVTNNVTDDDRTLEGGNGSQIMPTDYMILNGSGTDGLNYKLMTSSTITDASTTERRTVTSFEQYWRNNPTAQVASGGTKNSTVVATNNSTLTGYGWHNYKTWVNAANWDGTKYTINGKEYSKNYLYDDHWYMTVNVGDGSLDIVETNIDGVLVLLDNHGWEIMRQPIVATSDADYESVQTALKKYDSPMVKNYKFYSTNNVNHKVPGYHKYDITYQTSDKTNITGLTLVNSSETITSLANYPVMMKNGALTDLYVTYDVKDEYASSYTGEATEAETSASNFLLQQGSNYAKANGTNIESTTDASAADHWKLKPNFNIDEEMGYIHTGGSDGEKTKSELETLYNTNKMNGFDPYNLQIQSVTTNNYFTTNATAATLGGGIWTGNGSTLSLAAVSTHITPTGYDNKTLAVTNATFMAVQDANGNMRLMPRFQHEQVVDNFATLADPETLSAYDATNAQTTQLSTPVTYHIIDNSGNDALQMTVTGGIGLNLPDALKSPMVSEYQFHSTQAHASAAETRATGDLTVAQEDVYVSYTVDASKMAASKAYAIIASNSNIYMHVNFRVNESHSDNRFWTMHQQWDVSNGNGTKLNATNLPFIDDNYLWELGDDPYNIQIKNKKTGLYNEPVSTDSQGDIKTSATASYCLLYWNAETAGSNYTLRYREATPSVTPYYVAYTTINDGDWRVRTSANEADAKLTLLYDETLPNLDINVQQKGSDDVEATLRLHYVSTAKMSDFSTKLPYFLRRAYTKDDFAFYYDAAGKNGITANATFDTNYFDGSNIYMRYSPVDDWNTDNLFRVSATSEKTWYAILYNNGTEDNQQYLYLNTSNNQVRGKYKKNSSATDDNFNWALIGSPYALKLVNRAAKDKYIGLPQSTSTAAYAQPYAEDAEGIITDWELTVVANSNANSYPSIRPQGSFSQSDRPWFYLCTNGDSPSLQPLFSSQDRIIKAYEKIVTIDVTYHVKDNASGQVVDFTITTIAGNNIGTLPTSLVRRGTKNVSLHTGSFEGSAIAADATSTTELTDIYVTYDIDYTDNANNNQLGIADMFSTWENPKWFTIKNGTQQIYYGGNNYTSVQNNRNGVADSDLWAFIGTPYKFEIINYLAGASLHAATNAKDKGSRVCMQDDDKNYPYYYWETVTTTKNGGGLAIRLTGTDYCLSFAQGFNDNHGVISADGNNQADKLTIAPVSMVTFNIYGPDNTLSGTRVLPIPQYTDMTISTGATASNGLEKELKRRYITINTISTNADFSSAVDSYTVTAESDNQTIYMKWDYTDDAPVFSTGSEPRNYQYYLASVYSGNSDYNYSMGVTGDTESGYTIEKREIALTESTITNQFALVGNPYAFKLYNRFVGGFISAGTKLTIDSDDSNDIVFDMAVPSEDKPATKFIARRKGASMSLNSNGTDMFVSQGENTVMLSHIVVPVYVFKEGATASANIVDYQEYALNLNPSSVARATSERIVDTNLNVTNNAVGKTNDFRHAFCDYTFYHGYDWETGTLSNAIPSSGDYAGLPYYGGSSDQFARAFFATYTVDEEQFSIIYLLDNANTTGGLRYFGSGEKSTSGDNVYYTLKSESITLEAAREDNTNAYRWIMTGDPYNLQMTCLGTGDDYQGIPLGVQDVCTTNSTPPTVGAGTLARLTNDGTYAVKSHWEVILNSAGNHVFFLTDDVTTYDDADRYTYSLGQQTYTTASLFASSDQIYALHLTPAIPQYNVIWNIMEGGGGGYTGVATYTKENVSKGTTMTLADLPEVLKRHFCEYDNMYSEQTCTTLFANNEATVGDGDLSIFVTYTLKTGAPMFYASVADYNAAEGDAKDPVLIRLKHAKYAYTTAAADESATTTDSKETASSSKWVLIGSPYNVKLYNILTGKYLYVNWSNISPDAVIPMAASPDANTTNDTWTILDDASGDYAVLCLKEDDNHQMLFVGYDTSGNVVMTIPNSKSEAMTAEFLGSNGIDGPTLVLHYGENTLRKDASNNSMAGQTESFTVSGFFNQGTPLVDIMPSVMKRPFCNYTFKYGGTEYTDVVKNPMCTDSQPITIDVYYTRDESLFKWSTATVGNTGKYWYYLVNNHVPAGSGEQGKMYYRDSSPKLRVSQSLVQSKLYLNNFEWCVIGDPYGFKMLNRYDPDHKFREYISVMNYNDSHNDGLQLEQTDGDTQDVFEMMPGTYSYNFWMHPVYTEALRSELSADACSYVGNNYNGSAAIIPTAQKTMAYLKANSSANLRLERRSDSTLKEYLNYAGMVGSLKYDVVSKGTVEIGGVKVGIATIKAKIDAGTATDAEKTAIHDIINTPDSVVQMKQGYYRLVPYTWEKNKNERRYVRGYLDSNEQTASSGLKVETLTAAEYDPASIFWFNATTETETNYPRYYVKTQGLSLKGNNLGTGSDYEFKCRYEDIGAGIMQLRSTSVGGTDPYDYLSCAGTDGTSTNHCFDEQAGLFKTRFYLQPVGIGGNELPFKMRLNKGHDGFDDSPVKADSPLKGLPYTYTSLYVPFDICVAGGLDKDGRELEADACDMEPFWGHRENYHAAYSLSKDGDTYYNATEYALICVSLDEHKGAPGGNKEVPAATPVIFRSLSGMQEVTFTIPENAPKAATSPITGNVLQGKYLDTTDDDAQIRVFGKEEVQSGTTWYSTGRVGFFPRAYENNAYYPIPHNKAYYVQQVHAENPNSRKAIFFEFDTTGATGVTEVGSRHADDTMYDLQGRKVEQVYKSGVYIVNGRKVVVKKERR